ncbi:HD domain-containing protein [Peribacillus sp. SCS-37]|uniref:HD domain-containing protein n=1 Tax=Paraperibacillus esterisolvens TaxID=3115296 RepID=UPI003906556F
MENAHLISRCEVFVKNQMRSDTSGHDWHHIMRVRSLAMQIAREEGSDSLFLVEMAALLHDIPDEKLNESEEAGFKKLDDWFKEQEMTQETIDELSAIIRSIPFKGGNNLHVLSPEAKIVQDADRLDAMGAIGIARTFAYGGKKGQPIYEPEMVPRNEMTIEEYREGRSSSINHFYEKLLKLKDLLHTDAAKKLSEDRQSFMGEFLKQFYKEWNV